MSDYGRIFNVTHGFGVMRELMGLRLTNGSERVDVGEWQSMDISDKPMLVTHELRHVRIGWDLMPTTVEHAQEVIKPNLPWAEDHFLERVGGEPLNPPPSHQWWPFAQKNNEEHTEGGKFSHTYPERFWPKYAGETWRMIDSFSHTGIRYDYGDLQDVVMQLVRNPLTRQAYLPVWFPEDTGAVDGQRVPCTLGYHFLIRNGRLDISYSIRSCDFLRHWADDVYMAVRLAQWMRDQLRIIGYTKEIPSIVDRSIEVGEFIMNIGSLHVFEGDMPRMKKEFQI